MVSLQYNLTFQDHKIKNNKLCCYTFTVPVLGGSVCFGSNFYHNHVTGKELSN